MKNKNTAFTDNAFIIRSTSNNKAIYNKAMKKYDNHLKKIEKDIPKSLLTYFGSDFFHDGSISNMSYTDDFQNLRCKMSCPNIKYHKNEEEYEYVNCGFKCTFLNLVYFKLIAFRHA